MMVHALALGVGQEKDLCRPLDERPFAPYLTVMATRLLLTLLALLTGLAAQFAPAQARAFRAVDTEIGSVTRTGSPVRGTVAVNARPQVSVQADLRLPTLARTQDAPLGLSVPTVLQGIDRARQ